MCCFSLPIAEVSGTSIFARLDGKRQVLAYQMHLSSVEDVAMILPLPVEQGHGEKALEFVDLSEAPELFKSLSLCFWQPSRSPSTDLSVAAAGGQSPLEVHRVGAFDASFVPRPADFSRIDPRFRLSESILRQLPGYADYGFAVFKLRKGEAEVHPMALRFLTRSGSQLFFPTVHVHRGDVPGKAEFDHTLYAQAPVAGPTGWEKAPRAVEDVVNLGNILRRDPTRGIVERGWSLLRRRIEGQHRNVDTWVETGSAS